MSNFKTNIEFENETHKELAFSVGGRNFYQMNNGGTPIYIQRFNAVQDRLKQHEEWKLTDEVLTSYLFQLEKAIDNGDPKEAKEVIEKIKWRRKQTDNLELVYDLMSVFYFGENEDPAIYDRGTALQNIKFWTSKEWAKEVLAFFLSTPLTKFVPSLDFTDSSTMSYLAEKYLTLFAQQKITLLQLSESEKNSDIGKNIQFLAEMYSDLAELTDSVRTNGLT